MPLPTSLTTPPSAGTRSASGLANIQVLRGLAAVAVLAYHVCVYAQDLRGAARPLAEFDALLGLWGVAVFFAISGFLMAGLVRRDRPAVFLAHRIARIFPTYLAVVALFAGLFLIVGLGSGGPSPLALSLAPTGPRSYPLNVEWTLVFETSFYVGLFLVALAGWARHVVPLAVAWLALLALAFVLLPAGVRDAVPPPLYLLPLAAACIPFAGGLLLPRLIAGGFKAAYGLLALPLSIACLFVEMDVARWLGGIAAVLLVGAAAAGPQFRGEGMLPRAALALGDWSYVLYLVHVPVLLIVAHLCPTHWSGVVYGLLGVAAALGTAALLGPLDIALYRALRRRIDAASPRSLSRWLGAYLAVFAGCAAWGSTETARNDWRESRAQTALAAMPPDSWTMPDRARTVIAGHGRVLPASVRGSLESIERITSSQAMVSGFAYDPATPDRTMLLALFCEGRLAGIDRPRRIRKDLAGQPGLDGLGQRRIGYRMRIPLDACPAASVPLAVVVDRGGRMAVLPGPAGR